MNLFGCKFCDPETGICDRKNFDSLLWATVTVFQVSSCAILCLPCRLLNLWTKISTPKCIRNFGSWKLVSMSTNGKKISPETFSSRHDSDSWWWIINSLSFLTYQSIPGWTSSHRQHIYSIWKMWKSCRAIVCFCRYWLKRIGTLSSLLASRGQAYWQLCTLSHSWLLETMCSLTSLSPSWSR